MVYKRILSWVKGWNGPDAPWPNAQCMALGRLFPNRSATTSLVSITSDQKQHRIKMAVLPLRYAATPHNPGALNTVQLLLPTVTIHCTSSANIGILQQWQPWVARFHASPLIIQVWGLNFSSDAVHFLVSFQDHDVIVRKHPAGSGSRVRYYMG